MSIKFICKYMNLCWIYIRINKNGFEPPHIQRVVDTVFYKTFCFAKIGGAFNLQGDFSDFHVFYTGYHGLVGAIDTAGKHGSQISRKFGSGVGGHVVVFSLYIEIYQSEIGGVVKSIAFLHLLFVHGRIIVSFDLLYAFV